MRLLTAAEMRAADASAIENFGIPSAVLMENAALGVVKAAEDMSGNVAGKKIAVFCGAGNNGGDGYAAARHLFNRHASVKVFMLCAPEDLQGDAALNFGILQKMGVETQLVKTESQINLMKLSLINCDIIIDALLGTGLTGAVSGKYKAVIDVINSCRCPVIAVDIPSGLNADDGSIHGSCIRADVTVTFAYPKIGMVFAHAGEYVGKLIVADISMPQEIEQEISAKRELITAEFCRRFLPDRNSSAHKGDFGTLLLAAGSEDMPGAAALSADAAFACGVGRVQAALPHVCRQSFAALVPEATLISLAEDNKAYLHASCLDAIRNKEFSAMVMGMGLGRAEATGDAVKALLSAAEVPAVVDADALFALIKEKDFVRELNIPLIFTPHEGEFARLYGRNIEYIKKNRLAAAQLFAIEWKVILVLKGANTIVATPDGRVFINNTGNPGMATAGSGDVLSGMIGALLAQKLPPAAAAAVGVYLHGAAGDAAASQLGEYSVKAGDILRFIPAAFKSVR